MTEQAAARLSDRARAFKFIEDAPWTFAKTMPENPHEYTVRGQTPHEEYDFFIRHIRSHGYKEKWGGRSYVYLNVGAWRYWTMGRSVEGTTIINRAKVKADPNR